MAETSKSTVKQASFFGKVDWSAFWTATIITLIVYCWTLAPTVTLEDCGELATASAYLGVPHPPGYPIWTITTWFFTKLFAFVTFRGQPNPSWSVGLASAVFGAFAAGFTSILICRSGRDMLRSIKHATEKIGTSTEDIFCWASGVASSLVFAFSPVVWSQSVIVEVYALNAFFLVLIIFLTYTWIRSEETDLKWVHRSVFGVSLLIAVTMGVMAISLVAGMNSANFMHVGKYYLSYTVLGAGLIALLCFIWRHNKSSRLLYLAALVFGLGLTNYQVLLLLGLTMAIAVMVKDMRLLRDFVIAGAPYLFIYGLIKLNGLPGIDHPTGKIFYVYMFLNALWLCCVYFLLPNGKTVAGAFLYAIMGVSVYAYMPLASETNPPMNWGYPRTYEGFLHAIFRGQYEKIIPTPIFSWQFVEQLGAYLSDLRGTFTLPVVVIGSFPFAAWSLTLKGKRIRALNIAIVLAVAAVGLIMIEEALVPAGKTIFLLSMIYRILVFVLVIITLAGALSILMEELQDYSTRMLNRKLPLSERIFSGLFLTGVAGLAIVTMFMLAGKIGDVISPLKSSAQALPPEEIRFIFTQVLGLVALIIGPPLLCAGVILLRRGETQLLPDFDRKTQSWMVITLSGFLVMSVILVDLASPKGDIQDAFIQRVKFISSHALFGLWIGYGLLLGLSYVTAFFNGNRFLKWTGVLSVLGLIPAIPLLLNAYNPQLLKVYGGAEQNGHDFGWQFGNYQLRGAEAITEELDPDEEPIPDPTYPEEMGPNAVFFGGTDPGRFVPTYMIFGADVRPDVFLITQNALADNTYMSVMRDLYGDQIWIPSQQDSAKAFHRYVDEVNRGIRRRNADLKIEDGRVQVSGAMGVMEINGLLAQMIFEHNNYRHSFYVEESYVIQWMFPYLTPHGLILKINKDQQPGITVRNVKQDTDFWDWYTRKLSGDSKFIRDIVARKSFSKLRSAIAGVYAFRGAFDLAENAFKEARLLYPLSPEANFRLVQEVLVPMRRFDEAIAIMEEFYREDPGNKKVPEFVGFLRHLRSVDAGISAKEAQISGSSKLEAGTALELAELYREASQVGKLMGLSENILNNSNLPPEVYFRLAGILQQAGIFPLMNRALDSFEANASNNVPPEAFIDAARFYAQTKQFEKMLNSLDKYLNLQPSDWRAWLDRATVLMELKRVNEATESINRALSAGGQQALTAVRNDKRFAPLLQMKQQKASSLLNLGRQR